MAGMFRAAWLTALVLSSQVNAENLRLSGWGGLYGDVYKQMILKPFSEGSAMTVTRLSEDVFDADIVELSLQEAIRGCDEGDLMWLSPDSLRDPASLIPNAVQPCSVAQWSWATVVGYSNNMFRGVAAKPALISDFFNTTDFPGKRVLKRSPRTIVAWALNAGGVPADETYLALNDIDSAWPLVEEQLRQIENEVIWVDNDAEALTYLREGTATFALLSSSSMVRDSFVRGVDLGVVWDAAVMEVSLLAIPTSAKNPDAALEFLSYIASSENSLEFAAALGYGPVEYESARLIDQSIRQYMPVDPESFTNVIWDDATFWQTQTSMEWVARYSEWSDKVRSMQSLVMAEPAEIVSVTVDALTPVDVLTQTDLRAGFWTSTNF